MQRCLSRTRNLGCCLVKELTPTGGPGAIRSPLTTTLPPMNRRPLRLRKPCSFSSLREPEPHWTISATVNLDLRSAKGDENRRAVRIAPMGAARLSLTSGAVEAEQLFDPERA
jgi:hypothetical protein